MSGPEQDSSSCVSMIMRCTEKTYGFVTHSGAFLLGGQAFFYGSENYTGRVDFESHLNV